VAQIRSDYEDDEDVMKYLGSMDMVTETAFRVVTGPKSLDAGRKDPKWAIPLAVEISTLTEGPLVIISSNTAKEAIRHGADLVNIFPVYEEKEKDGKTIYKVRLVGDGRMHKNAGTTYAETPSREEFRIFMHLVASKGWTFYHVDEKRAFLSAKHNGPEVVAKLGTDFYKVDGALYGLKTAPRDYQSHVVSRLVDKMRFMRMGMCSCIYIRPDPITDVLVYIYEFVDDFLWSGPDEELTDNAILEYRKYADCTDTVRNPVKVLGMELERDLERRTISITLAKKAEDMLDSIIGFGLLERFNLSLDKTIDVPLTSNNVHIGDSHFVGDTRTVSEDLCELCNTSEINQYLVIVGD